MVLNTARQEELMDDVISRQEAIDVIDKIFPADPMRNDYTQGITCGAALATEYIKQLPSAQPVDKDTNVPCTDTISRQAAIDALKNERSDWNCDYNVPVDHCIDAIYSVPSAQPEQTNSWCNNSWCINCKEYDTENKCCHRYNRVIKQTLDEVYAHAETEAEARFHDEIVRCKDCTFYRSDGCFFSTAEVGEDGFCSWGRKENR